MFNKTNIKKKIYQKYYKKAYIKQNKNFNNYLTKMK